MTLRTWVINEIIDILPQYIGTTVGADEFAHTIFSSEFAIGSYTYNAEVSEQWIKEYFRDIGDLLFYLDDDYRFMPNPFYEQEKFQLEIIDLMARQIIADTDFLDGEETVLINEEFINKFIEEWQ